MMTVAEYLEQKGLQMGLQKGLQLVMEKGQEQLALEVARNMLQTGKDRQTIKNITRLTDEEINALSS